MRFRSRSRLSPRELDPRCAAPSCGGRRRCPDARSALSMPNTCPRIPLPGPGPTRAVAQAKPSGKERVKRAGFVCCSVLGWIKCQQESSQSHFQARPQCRADGAAGGLDAVALRVVQRGTGRAHRRLAQGKQVDLLRRAAKCASADQGRSTRVHHARQPRLAAGAAPARSGLCRILLPSQGRADARIRAIQIEQAVLGLSLSRPCWMHAHGVRPPWSHAAHRHWRGCHLYPGAREAPLRSGCWTERDHVRRWASAAPRRATWSSRA